MAVTFRACLGAVAQLRKMTLSFVMSVRPSVRLSARNNSALTGRIFMEFDTSIFRKSLEKIQLPLKCGQNNGYFT
jgi:hypothetical protein